MEIDRRKLSPMMQQYFEVKDKVLFDIENKILVAYLMTKTDEVYTVPDGTIEISYYSLHRNPYNNTNVTGFWEASPEENSNLGFWFKIYNQYVSHTYNTKSNYLPVRCVRD